MNQKNVVVEREKVARREAKRGVAKRLLKINNNLAASLESAGSCEITLKIVGASAVRELNALINELEGYA